MVLAIFDYGKWLILVFVIQLSNKHFIQLFTIIICTLNNIEKDRY